MVGIEEITEYKKGRYRVRLDNGMVWPLYRGEIHSYRLAAGMELSKEEYDKILSEVFFVRAKRRAMHLLERMDRTEAGLREKLRQNEYPEEAIEEAIAYVKRYHYIDDARYAAAYVRCYQNTRSKRRIMMDLLSKGISRTNVDQALECEYEADECEKIGRLLVKKGYNGSMQPKEQQRIYAFLMRRGFKSEDILKAMKCSDYLT